MPDPPFGMNKIEWLESVVPEGDYCGKCENIENGKCTTWGQDVTPNTRKCKWCEAECRLPDGKIAKIRDLKKKEVSQ